MKNIILFILLTISPLICGLLTIKVSNRCFVVKKEEVIEKPTRKNVYEYMKKVGIKYPEVALMQACFESGNFKSKLFKRHSNMFGMRHPKKRATESLKPSKSGYATYKNWKSSIIDYGLWQSRILHKCPTKRKYIEYLSRAYAESPDYGKIFKNV